MIIKSTLTHCKQLENTDNWDSRWSILLPGDSEHFRSIFHLFKHLNSNLQKVAHKEYPYTLLPNSPAVNIFPFALPLACSFPIDLPICHPSIIYKPLCYLFLIYITKWTFCCIRVDPSLLGTIFITKIM